MNAITSFRGEYAFLSNFYTLDKAIYCDLGVPYMTVEHAFQAMKSLDRKVRLRITNAPSPSAAKLAGRLADLRPDWEAVKVQIMRELLAQKFPDEPVTLSDRLVDTEDAYLLEGNTWHDNFWGICSCRACAAISGENWLGRLLMERREELRGEVLG